jgi:retron-type reverse transcriptase
MAETNPKVIIPEDWRERARKIGADAFTHEEMVRLGFWPPSPKVAQQHEDTLEQVRILGQKLAQLDEGIGVLTEKINGLEDLEAILRDIRRRRIERVKADRLKKRGLREAARKDAQEKDAEWRRVMLPHLGREVSAGLRFTDGDRQKLSSLGLPILELPSDLAESIGISTGELAWLCYHRAAAGADHYWRFTIPKRSGGTRTISSPKPKLRRAQRWVLEHIINLLAVHDAATAFRQGASIAHNASHHVGKAVVIRIDLKDFFPSITFRRVKGLYQSFGYNEGVSTLLSLLTTESPRSVLTLDGKQNYVALGARQLPQGACTSPAISNLIARKIDKRAAGLASSRGFQYSRYADDLVFSHESETAPVGFLLDRVKRIVTEEGFTLNPGKTAVMRPSQRQAVTGVVVNTRAGVSRKDIRRFRAFLHQCTELGLEEMSRRLDKDAANYARGYLAFVHMVNPEQAKRLVATAPWLSTHDHQQ